jgi:hypothetical protein
MLTSIILTLPLRSGEMIAFPIWLKGKEITNHTIVRENEGRMATCIVTNYSALIGGMTAFIILVFVSQG